MKNNRVVLEDSVHLPDGAHVGVRVIEPLLTHEQIFAHVRSNRISRDVGMDDIIEADKQEREEHPVTSSVISEPGICVCASSCVVKTDNTIP